MIAVLDKWYVQHVHLFPIFQMLILYTLSMSVKELVRALSMTSGTNADEQSAIAPKLFSSIRVRIQNPDPLNKQNRDPVLKH